MKTLFPISVIAVIAALAAALLCTSKSRRTGLDLEAALSARRQFDRDIWQAGRADREARAAATSAGGEVPADSGADAADKARSENLPARSFAELGLRMEYARFADEHGMTAEQLNRVARAVAGLRRAFDQSTQEAQAAAKAGANSGQLSVYADRRDQAGAAAAAEIKAAIGEDGYAALRQFEATRMTEAGIAEEIQPWLIASGAGRLSADQASKLAAMILADGIDDRGVSAGFPANPKAGGRGSTYMGESLNNASSFLSPQQQASLQYFARVKAMINEPFLTQIVWDPLVPTQSSGL